MYALTEGLRYGVGEIYQELALAKDWEIIMIIIIIILIIIIIIIIMIIMMINVPSDRNISLKEPNKVSKYKNPEIEIQMWHLKTQTIPAINGALGMIKKQEQRSIETIPCFAILAGIMCAMC